MILLVVLAVITLFLLSSTEQESRELFQNAKLLLRFLIKALSTFFDLMIKLLKGLMNLGEAFLGQTPPQKHTPVPTPTPGPQEPTPSVITVELMPSRVEIIKCCGGLGFIVVLTSLVLGFQQIFKFISRIF